MPELMSTEPRDNKMSLTTGFLLLASNVGGAAAGTTHSPTHGALGLKLEFFNNTALSGTSIVSPPGLSTTFPLIFTPPHNAIPFSARASGTLSLDALRTASLSRSEQLNASSSVAAAYAVECTFNGPLANAFVWIDDHLVCSFGGWRNNATDRSSIDGSPAYPLPLLPTTRNASTVRIDVVSNGTTRSATPLPPCTVNLQWRPCGATIDAGCWAAPPPLQALPSGSLSPHIPPLEQRRLGFQRGLLRGWASWHPRNYLALISLPDASRLSFALCQLSAQKCLTATQGPDDRNVDAVRLDTHALDRSFAALHIAYSGLNISMRWGADPDAESGIRLLVEPVLAVVDDARLNLSDYVAVFSADFAWGRSGLTAIGSSASSVSSVSSWSLPQNMSTTTTLKWSPTGNLAPHALFLRVEGGATRAPVSEASAVRTFAASPPTALLPLTYVVVTLGAKSGGAIALSSYTSDTDVDAVRTALDTAEKREHARLLAAHGNSAARAEVAGAIRAALLWNLIFVPAETGPVLPVDREWDLSKSPISDDFRYTMFQWDNHFASFMLSRSVGNVGVENAKSTPDAKMARDIALSNVISTIRSTKTARGFGSNYAAGGSKSVDRTEPPQAARVLHAIVENCEPLSDCTWVVELLLDDLVDWSDWFFAERTLQMRSNNSSSSSYPHTSTTEEGGLLISLGSTSVAGYNDYAPDTVQGARFESGLDNSPMYDCTNGPAHQPPTAPGEPTCAALFNVTSQQMQIADVGMSAMVASEARHIALLAQLLPGVRNKALAARMNARADALAAALSAHTWNEELGTFVNRFGKDFNESGKFVKRVSPTSFYPLMAHAATDAQVGTMMTKWLTNRSRFAITGDVASNAKSNYWGLPSISADDKAFKKLGYWRGYVWGPMAQLTWWSLREYDHVPAARAVRKALATQMTALMLSQWRRNRYICENFEPFEGAFDYPASSSSSSSLTFVRLPLSSSSQVRQTVVERECTIGEHSVECSRC